MPEAVITPQPTGAEAPPTPQSAPAEHAPQAATERPAWLSEGFDSPEALAAAYAKLTTGSQTEQPGENNTNKPNETPAPGTDESVAKFVQDSGLDPMALSREIATTGDINAEAKAALSKKLEKAGLPASMIDEYISGQNAVKDAAVRDVMAVAGGEEGFNAMAEWARENLSDTELEAFSNIMLKADINTAKLTVGNLYARYKGNAAIPGSRLKGSTGTGGGDIFHSWEQQIEAQKDARYAKDPAYRTEVERKIERTLKAGGYRNISR